MFFRTRFGILLPVLLIGSLILGAPLQEKAPSLKGTVTDPAGNPLPQALVTLSNLNLQVTRTAMTGQKGEFAFHALPAGTYRLEALAKGFDPLVREDVRITKGETLTLELIL